MVMGILSKPSESHRRGGGLPQFGWHRNADSSVESSKERGWRDDGDSELCSFPHAFLALDSYLRFS